ncbi:MAG: redox-sensing transcriptional repressor Rex [Lentisphaerae bacterium]|nr:redox-sensing transcriptional repressor Rex [Lentisphaerota bacterium]
MRQKHPSPRRPDSISPVAISSAQAAALADVHKAGVAGIKRLPGYLQLLRELQADGHEFVSGTVLAETHDLEPAIVRKDLAVTGIIGTPRRGFCVNDLIVAIEHFLGWNSPAKAVLVGVGNLGAALLGYRGFDDYGLRIAGAFDRDPARIGLSIHGRKIQPVEKLTTFVRATGIILGVLTVPAGAAQEATDLMVQAGIRGIWNFTPTKVKVPEHVVTQKEDLAEGLAVLSHRLQHLMRPASPV